MTSKFLNLWVFTLPLIFLYTSCNGQIKGRSQQVIVGGGCEGCEAIYEYADKLILSRDTLPEFHTTEPKIMLTGTVFKKDGVTPASGVLMYIYHTDRKGEYKLKGDESGWAKRHGYIRGWVKSDEQGQYTFFTFRPAAYRDGSEPEHIHMVIKELDKNEYYIDDITFTDDPLLTISARNKSANRAGSGIVKLTERKNIMIANRDIILGKNIPNYY